MNDATLTWAELRQAALVGCNRRIRALYNARDEPYGTPQNGGWEADVIGAAGEMAVAKALGLFWADSRDLDRHRGDVGPFQVRSTALDHGGLILHESDKDEAVFVLTVGTAPWLRVPGWLTAGYGKNPRFWRADLRDPSFLVPQHELVSMEQWPANG